MRTPHELTDAFRSRGLKVTPQRQLLFRLLFENTTHPTADALYGKAVRQMPGISRRTVYQTLNDLASMGELQSLAFDSGAVRFDPNVDEHHHVVCSVCGIVRDVYLARVEPITAEVGPQLGADGAEVADVADDFEGFEIDQVAVVVSGRCRRCAGRDTSSSG